VRVDRITADFIDRPGGAEEIDRTIVVPRAHVRWDHDDRWTSRFSAGRGYRAPLSFFESDHGILEDGFEVDVDELEESLGYSYALSFDNDTLSATLSLARADLENLAFLDGSGDRPVLRNADEDVSVSTYDLVTGWRVSEHFEFGASFEYFDYDDAYKGTFSVAPIEERARLTADYDRAGWVLSGTLTWIGSINLEDYGYIDRYEVFQDLDGDGLAGPGELSRPKSLRAPDYVMLDVRVAREFAERYTVYLGAINLTDYTQSGDADSPLFYDSSGGYDVAHIYGPLRGRVIYGGLRARF